MATSTVTGEPENLDRRIEQLESSLEQLLAEMGDAHAKNAALERDLEALRQAYNHGGSPNAPSSTGAEGEDLVDVGSAASSPAEMPRHTTPETSQAPTTAEEMEAIYPIDGLIADQRTRHLIAKPATSIAVLVCCYSGEPFFEETVESIVRQTTRDLTIVFHDNGCHPQYSRKIEEVSQQVGGVVFRSKVNRYGEGLRHDVLPYIRHEYIAVIHDDDVYLPKKVERGLKSMREDNLDYLFTKRRPLDENLRPLSREYDAVNTDMILASDFPHRYIAELFYKGLRLHFSTLMMKTAVARRTLLGDPYLPRIADALFFADLLLDRNLKGTVLPSCDTLVRIHKSNDFLYEKFEGPRRGSELMQRQISEFLGFQRVLDEANDELLGKVLAIFPGVTDHPTIKIDPREDRVTLLVKAGLLLRPWGYGKRLLGVYCLHLAFRLDGMKTMCLVRQLSGEDANFEIQSIYAAYVDEVRSLLA